MINGLFLNRFTLRNIWTASVHNMLAMMDLVENHHLEVPKNMRLSEKPDNLTIEYSWFKVKYLILIFLFPIGSYVVVQSPYIQGSLDQMTLPVYIIIACNLAVIYYSLTRLLNITTIIVNKNRIQIEHKPLPMSKNITITRGQLTQLYVTKHRRAHRYYLYASTYQLNAILSNGDIVTVLKSLYHPEQGRFIEHKIEQFLEITDVAVEGEIDK